MRAVIKRVESMERTKWQTLQKKKSTTQNTARLNQPLTHHIFDVKLTEKNIGTRTVDYWLWMMNQELLAALGQYIEG